MMTAYDLNTKFAASASRADVRSVKTQAMGSQPIVRLETACRSDIGLRRELNEDHCLLATEGIHIPGVRSVAVVADGMGGHDAGDVASKIVCDFLEHLFVKGGVAELSRESRISMNDPESLLVEGLRRINEKIVERARSFNLLRTMGSTCVAALLLEELGRLRLVVGWIGDSRCYIVRGSSTLLVTEDDTCVWDMYRNGQIAYKDIQHHPKRNILTQALGTGDKIVPHARTVDIVPGDALVISTDGLHGCVSDRDMLSIVGGSATAEAAAGKLIEVANRTGGKDNISVAVIRCLPHAGGASLIQRPWVRRGVLTLGIAACSVIGVGSFIASNTGSAHIAESSRTPSIDISILDPVQVPRAGELTDIRFTLRPYESVREIASKTYLVTSLDGVRADTLLLAGIAERTPNVFAIRARFDAPRLHRMRLTLVDAEGQEFGRADAYVDVREPLSPRPRIASVEGPSHSARSMFRLTRGWDNRIQVWLTDQGESEKDVDVQISVGGATDLVTLTRRNSSIPKATSLEYVPGARAHLRTVGSQVQFTQVLP